MWVPVGNLRQLEKPMASQTTQSANSLNSHFMETIDQLIYEYSKTAIEKLF